ncbi:hypothetical protein LINGRAHAP2_LOCUS18944 [Linum grandiflorum]
MEPEFRMVNQVLRFVSQRQPFRASFSAQRCRMLYIAANRGLGKMFEEQFQVASGRSNHSLWLKLIILNYGFLVIQGNPSSFCRQMKQQNSPLSASLAGDDMNHEGLIRAVHIF